MSITFEYSFNSELDLPQLVEAVNRALGTSLQTDDDDTFRCTFLGMSLALGRNDHFPEYRYQLWNKTWAGSSLRSIQLEALVLAIFVLHEIVGITDGMLSYEMQRVLARYGTLDGVWCDTTTAAAIDPSAHIADLLHRLDEFYA